MRNRARSTIFVVGYVGVVGAVVLAARGQHPVHRPLPTYQRVLQLETTSETSANVAFGDLDGNGTLDVVLAKGRHWPLVNRVLLTDGHGHITSAHDLGTASDRTYSGRLVDLDGDGDLDVVISNDAPDPKLVYLNDGHGNFRAGSPYGRAEWPTRNAAVGDLNGDGLPDIIVANRGDKESANYVCLNHGAGQFGSTCVEITRDPATTITPADINRDEFLDLVVPYRDHGQSHVYLNDGNGNFSMGRRIPFGPADGEIRMAEVADFDGDGRLDIVTIDEGHGTDLYFGQTGGGFSGGLSIAGSKPTCYALIVGDLNRDGHPDIVVGNIEAPSVVYFNSGNGRHFTPVSFGDGKGDAYGFALGDLDGDGVLDIGMARSGAPNVVYFGDVNSR